MKCEAITNTGKQCKRNSKEDSKFCYQHSNLAIKKPIKLQNKINNESIGITAEYIICELSGINFNTSPERIDRKDYNMLRDVGSSALNELPKINEHIGHLNNSIDFILADNKTLSVKTNFVKNTQKVCPQNIGQITRQKFIVIFKDYNNSQTWVAVYEFLHIYSLVEPVNV